METRSHTTRPLSSIIAGTKHILLYGLLMALLAFILKWLQWKYLVADNSLEIYIGLIAVLFTTLGIWIANQLAKPSVKTLIVEKEVYIQAPITHAIDETELERLNLSKREYEVLQLLASGHSNAEIAEQLFLSLSTVKTHVSNLFVKLDVKSRTQAVEKSKRLKIIL